MRTVTIYTMQGRSSQGKNFWTVNRSLGGDERPLTDFFCGSRLMGLPLFNRLMVGVIMEDMSFPDNLRWFYDRRNERATRFRTRFTARAAARRLVQLQNHAKSFARWDPNFLVARTSD